MLDDPERDNAIALSVANAGRARWRTGSRASRTVSTASQEPSRAPSRAGAKRSRRAEAKELGLVTDVFDDIDWDDELRMAIEERRSLSPDALTGLEANLRFVGPETMESRIYARLSAWQNWIFTRPNAVGEHGALTSYGKPHSPEFDWSRV